jgi:hypothetical protein
VWSDYELFANYAFVEGVARVEQGRAPRRVFADFHGGHVSRFDIVCGGADWATISFKTSMRTSERCGSSAASGAGGMG